LKIGKKPIAMCPTESHTKFLERYLYRVFGIPMESVFHSEHFDMPLYRSQELKDLPEFELVLVRGTHISRLPTSWTRHPTTVAVSGGWGRVETKGLYTPNPLK